MSPRNDNSQQQSSSLAPPSSSIAPSGRPQASPNLRDQIKTVIEQDLLARHELSAHDVPGGLRERYISGHYREPHKKFTSYLGSIFQIHNESLNIWTAIISVICISVWFWRHCMERSIFQTPEAWPITLVASAMITTHIASANAHTMCHHSVEYSGVFYMFDYFGITIYLYVSGICTFVYSYPLSSNQDLMTITLVLSLFNAVAWPWFCSWALAAYRKTNELSQRPSFSTKLFGLNCFNVASCVYCAVQRIAKLNFSQLSEDVEDEDFDIGGYWYLGWTIVSAMDLAVYKFHIPESIILSFFSSPHSHLWDIFHSHTIHHILALISNLCHLEALESDWENKVSHEVYDAATLTCFRNVSTIALIVALSNFSVIFVLVGNFFQFIRQFHAGKLHSA